MQISFKLTFNKTWILVYTFSFSLLHQVASGKLLYTCEKMNEKGKKCLSIDMKTVFTSQTTERNSDTLFPTPLPTTPRILELLCENYCIEVWYAYNATLKCRKKIWVLLYLCLSLKSDKLSFMSNFNTWIDFAALIHLGCQSWTMLLWRKNWAPHLIGEPATLPIPTGNCSVWAIVYFTYWLLGMIVL